MPKSRIRRTVYRANKRAARKGTGNSTYNTGYVHPVESRISYTEPEDTTGWLYNEGSSNTPGYWFKSVTPRYKDDMIREQDRITRNLIANMKLPELPSPYGDQRMPVTFNRDVYDVERYKEAQRKACYDNFASNVKNIYREGIERGLNGDDIVFDLTMFNPTDKKLDDEYEVGTLINGDGGFGLYRKNNKQDWMYALPKEYALNSYVGQQNFSSASDDEKRMILNSIQKAYRSEEDRNIYPQNMLIASPGFHRNGDYYGKYWGSPSDNKRWEQDFNTMIDNIDPRIFDYMYDPNYNGTILYQKPNR